MTKTELRKMIFLKIGFSSKVRHGKWFENLTGHVLSKAYLVYIKTINENMEKEAITQQ